MSARYLRRPMSVPPPADDALSYGMAMAAVPVVFGAIGWLLDEGIRTGPIFLILFAFFGVAASFASAYYRYSARIAKQNEGKPWTRSGVDPTSGTRVTA
ncbi:MAG: AtpZ/AtpI family protein [Actinobacteria bacterium]|nr:AtpZ/AtpI family protein [Actinomycetota bacterium]